MFRFWGREIMGWLFVFLGLFIFYLCIALLLSPGPEFIFEGPLLMTIGIFVFRGGIHLLKVAVAARLAMAVQAEPAKPVAADKRKKESGDAVGLVKVVY